MKELTLPSGKTATFKKGNRQTVLNAQRKAKYPEEIMFALIAEITDIDGQPIVYEDLLEMDMEDVLILNAQLSGKLQSLQQSALYSFAKPQAGN